MPTKYALLSTYPPTQCGLATFSAALLAHLPQPGDHIGVVRVLDEPAPRFADEVVHDLVNGSAASAAAAADVLNGFDVVIVQHEYGIYGGPDGQDVVPLLEALYVPSIVVLHTVLSHPTPRQRMILERVIATASAVVTMTQTARSRLLDIYGARPEEVYRDTARCRRQSRRALIDREGRPAQGTDLGPAGTGQGNRARDRCDGTASRSGAASRLSGGRPDPSAGAGPRWRGLPAGAPGASTGPRCRGPRALRWLGSFPPAR